MHYDFELLILILIHNANVQYKSIHGYAENINNFEQKYDEDLYKKIDNNSLYAMRSEYITKYLSNDYCGSDFNVSQSLSQNTILSLSSSGYSR